MNDMDSLINLIIGDLVLSPEYIFVARVVAVLLAVEVVTSLLSAIVPVVRTVR